MKHLRCLVAISTSLLAMNVMADMIYTPGGAYPIQPETIQVANTQEITDLQATPIFSETADGQKQQTIVDQNGNLKFVEKTMPTTQIAAADMQSQPMQSQPMQAQPMQAQPMQPQPMQPQPMQPQQNAPAGMQPQQELQQRQLEQQRELQERQQQMQQQEQQRIQQQMPQQIPQQQLPQGR